MNQLLMEPEEERKVKGKKVKKVVVKKEVKEPRSPRTCLHKSL